MPAVYNSGGQHIANPWWHHHPNQVPPEPGNHDGGDGHGTTSPRDRSLRLSDTLLDQVVPVVYGALQVTARIGFWDLRAGYLYLGCVFSYGEQASITDVTISEESSTTGVYKATAHTGDGSSSISNYLTLATGWTAADTTHWQGYAHQAVAANVQSAQLPGSIAVRAKLGGKLVTPIGGGTATATTNPAVIAYDILTAAEFGNMDTSLLDDDSFQAVADFCDEDTGDGKARYAFVGAIYERDPLAAVRMVLQNCNGYLYSGPDGKIHLWAETMPAPITGEWTSASSGSGMELTEDSTAGAALTELEVGQPIIFNGEWGRVTQILDDDTFRADWFTYAAGAVVRPMTTVNIKQEDWFKNPASSEQSVLKAPDIIKVAFSDEDQGGHHTATVSYGAGTDKVSNISLNVTDASHAVRAAKTKLLVSHLEPYFWAGTVFPETGAALSPGDVVIINTDLVTDQPATVQQPIVANQDGTYSIKLREFDPGAFSDDTETTDTPLSAGQAWASSTVPIMNEIRYVYSGTAYSMINGTSGASVVGNTSRVTDLTGTSITLPNNVSLYAKETGGTTRSAIKMDSSNRLTMGDGSVDLYFNTGQAILLPTSGYIAANWAAKDALITWGTTYITYGNASLTTTVSGNRLKLDGYGVVKAGAPTTSDWASGTWGIHSDTSAGKRYLVLNFGGTIEKLELI